MIFGNNPVNASQADGLVELALGRLVAQVGSQEALVLDDPAVKIDHVQATVGPHRCIDRSEALVRAGKELAFFPNGIRVKLVQILVRGGEGFLGQKGTHRVGPGGHREDRSFPVLAVCPVAMHGQATDRGDAGDPSVLKNSSGLVVTVKGGIGTDSVDPVGGGSNRTSLARPLTVVGCPVDFEPLAVGIEVETPISIRTHAPLSSAPGGHLNNLSTAPGKLATGLRVVHPVVQGKVQGIFRMFDIAMSGGREIDQFLLFVTDQVTVLVLAEPKRSGFNH